MNYHIGRDGQQLGEFSEDVIRTGLREGRFLPTDLAWAEGMAGWQALGTLPQFQASAPAPAPSPPAPPAPSYGGQPQYGGLPVTQMDVLPPANAPGANGLAVTALVCGIVGLPGSFCCFGGVLSLVAVICGHIALGRIKRYPSVQSPKGMAIAGLVLGYIGLAVVVWYLAAVGLHWDQFSTEFQKSFHEGMERAREQQQGH